MMSKQGIARAKVNPPVLAPHESNLEEVGSGRRLLQRFI